MSRSAVISVVLALGVLVVLMPAPQRLVAICVLPFTLAAVFMTAPGLVGTLAAFFGAGTTDPSVAAGSVTIRWSSGSWSRALRLVVGAGPTFPTTP